MTGYLKLRRSYLLLGVASLVLLGFLFGAINLVEMARWRVHPSEQQIAKYIVKLGGIYGKDPNSSRHIVFVSVNHTEANDRDLEVILQLKHIEYLDITDSQVTDASIDRIFKHPHLRLLRVKGSAISTTALDAAIKKADGRISLDE